MPFADDLASRVFERLAAIDFPNIVELGPAEKRGVDEHSNSDDSDHSIKLPRISNIIGIYVYNRSPRRPLFLNLFKQDYLKRIKERPGDYCQFHEWLLFYIQKVEGYIQAIHENPEGYFEEVDGFEWEKNKGKNGSYKLSKDKTEIQNDDDLFKIVKTDYPESRRSHYEYSSIFPVRFPKYPSDLYNSIVTTEYFLGYNCFSWEDMETTKRHYTFRQFWKHLQKVNQSGKEIKDFQALKELEEYIFYLFCKVRALRLHCSSGTSKEPMTDDTLTQTIQQCRDTIKSIREILVYYRLESPPLTGDEQLVEGLFRNANSGNQKTKAPSVDVSWKDDPTANPDLNQGDGKEGNREEDSQVITPRITPPAKPRRQKMMARDQLKNSPGS
jgi:hypothetical protein